LPDAQAFAQALLDALLQGGNEQMPIKNSPKALQSRATRKALQAVKKLLRGRHRPPIRATRIASLLNVTFPDGKIDDPTCITAR
jgi:hypothetical protein